MFPFLEGSGQSPVVLYSVTKEINEDAAKDTANTRPQLCMFAITITMETKVSVGKWPRRRCRGPTSAVIFLGESEGSKSIAKLHVCQRTGQPDGTLLMQSPTATDLHFNDN